jgi:P pilus assembly chaperone PapD
MQIGFVNQMKWLYHLVKVKRHDSAICPSRDTHKSATMPNGLVTFKRLALPSALFAGAFIVGLLAFHHQADALRVTMKRVIFEGTKRTEVLTVINNAPEEKVYRLGWRQMKMTEDQSLEQVKEGQTFEGAKPIDDMIRYAPRRVVLAPGASQQIRLMLRRPKDLPDGEYRSHFWIQPEAEAEKFTAPTDESAKKAPAVQIKMLTGMTVPVFVRSGKMVATAKLDNAKAVRAGNQIKLSFVLHRDGNRSLYGDFEMLCGSVVAHQVRGIAVYTEIKKRNLSFTFPTPKEGCSSMKITYRADENDPLFIGKTMAETSVTVQ